jgi:hypothetical protein
MAGMHALFDPLRLGGIALANRERGVADVSAQRLKRGGE